MRWRISRPAALVLVLVLVLGGLAAVSTTPIDARRAEAAVALTVAPSTALTAPTPITVEVTGLTPSASVRVSFCNNDDITLADQCFQGFPVTADDSGNLQTHQVALPVIAAQPQSPPADCRTSQCFIVLTAFDGGDTNLLAEPISFAPDADPHIDPPTLTPDANLTPDQPMTLDIPIGNVPTGWPVEIAICPSSLFEECRSSGVVPTATSSPVDGAVHAEVTAATTALVPGYLDTSCVPTGCAVLAGSFPLQLAFNLPYSFATTPPPASTSTTTTSSTSTSTSTASTTTTSPTSTTGPTSSPPGVAAAVQARPRFAG